VPVIWAKSGAPVSRTAAARSGRENVVFDLIFIEDLLLRELRCRGTCLKE
jgi:hypothetical protein